jgi:hypothetical protein
MKESVTYLAIVEEGIEKGRLEEARQMLLELGGQRLGEPRDEVQATVRRIGDLDRLRRLNRRLLHVATWEELLVAP